MSVKRLLLCSAVWLDRTGAENNRLNRMRAALHQHGVETFLTGFGPGSQPPGWELRKDAFGATVPYRFSWSRWAYPSPAMRRLSSASRFHAQYGDALIRALKPDGLLVYTDQAPLVRSALRVGRRQGLPVVVDAAEYHRVSRHYLLNGVNVQQWLFRHQLVRRLDGLVGVGKAWCDWASRQGVAAAWVPGFAVSPVAVRTAPAAPGAPMRLVFVGHWVERECPGVLIEGLAKAIDRGVELQIDVLGQVDGSYREQAGLRVLERFPQVRRRMHFTGYLDDHERDERLALADFFVILRRPDRETEHLFPSRIPEYLASGNPLIISGTDTFSEIFEHRKTAWLLPMKPESDALAEAVVELWNDSGLRFEIGSAGRRLGQQLFDSSRLASGILETFETARQKSRERGRRPQSVVMRSREEID